MKWLVLGGVVLSCLGSAWAAEEFSLADMSPGASRTVSGGPLTIRPEAGFVYQFQFTPALTYRIRNDQVPGWALVIRAATPGAEGTTLSNWSYVVGSGVISGNGDPLGVSSDAGATGSLTGGLRVLTAPAPGFGDYVYQLGQFQFTLPDIGPAATYQTQLTMTLSAGGP